MIHFQINMKVKNDDLNPVVTINCYWMEKCSLKNPFVFHRLKKNIKKNEWGWVNNDNLYFWLNYRFNSNGHIPYVPYGHFH